MAQLSSYLASSVGFVVGQATPHVAIPDVNIYLHRLSKRCSSLGHLKHFPHDLPKDQNTAVHRFAHCGIVFGRRGIWGVAE
eukprot:6403453-Amphidinium_carterae.1